MYTSKHYTCEQIDQRLVQGYYDDCVAAGYTGTLEQFQEELLTALGISANGLDAGEVNILPGTGLEASKLQAALTEIVNNNLSTNQALAKTNQNFNEYKDEVANKYGDYQDVSEFIAITTDANDKIIEGIKKDGTKVFTGDVDAPNIRQLDTDVSQAKSQAQNATATAQQASVAAQHAAAQVSSLSEDVVDAAAQAQSAVEQTQQLSQDVVEKYGDYKDVSEFLEVVTDSEGKALEALHKDGTKEFFGRIKSPNIEETEQKVAQMEDSVSWFESMLSQEWAEVTLDDENHIINGVKKDGTAYFYKLESPTLEAKVKELVADMVGNAGKDVNLQPSAFLPAEIKSRTTDLLLPSFDDVTLTRVEINSQSDFEAAIMGQSATSATPSTHLLLNLNTDVYIRTNPNIAQGNTLVINGNGHKILGWNATYNASQVKGTNSYCNYNGNLYGANTFIAPDGEVLRLARTRCYDAASEIQASDNIVDIYDNIVFTEGDKFPSTTTAFSSYVVNGVTYNFNENSVYHCKFQLPPELEDLEINELNDVYINLTSDWMSVQAKVTKAENGWLYFDYVRKEADYDPLKTLFTNYIGINNDYHINHKYTSFYLINYKMEDNHSCLITPVITDVGGVDSITGHTLVFPNRYSSVGETYLYMFNLQAKDIKLKIFNSTLVGYRVVATKSTIDGNSGNIVVLDSCIIKGCVRSAVNLSNVGAEGYITNCEAYDCDMSVVQSGNQYTKLFATHNYIHDVGNRRANTYSLDGAGEYTYIAHNEIVNFAYGAIRTGIIHQEQPSGTNPTGSYFPCNSIVEYNVVRQTDDYFVNKARHMVAMDAGAIDNAIFNDEAIIRHNIVCNYVGRGGNRGIYLDGGACNVYVYGNIIANTPNSHSITARFAEDNPYFGLPYTLDNINKYILNNYVENGIRIGGRTNYPVDGGRYYSDETHKTGWNGEDLGDNGCYLGHNIINTQMQTTANDIKGIDTDHKEEQYLISIPAYQGSFSTSLDITGWLNKL
jgi:hypothetical protein